MDEQQAQEGAQAQEVEPLAAGDSPEVSGESVSPADSADVDLSGIEDRLDAIIDKLDGLHDNVDYSGKLDAIAGKVDGLKGGIDDVGESLGSLAGNDSNGDVVTILSNMVGVDVFVLFSLLLILGVLLAIVFITSLRRV